MAHTCRDSRQRPRQLRITHVIAALGLAAVASPAFGQDRGQPEISVGYLNVSGTMPGVNVQAAIPLTEHWNVVAEFNKASGADCSECEPEFRDTSVLGGVRFAWRPARRISPFWQLLAGGLHSKAGDYHVDYCCNLGRRLERGFTVDYLALQPGGGVTFMLLPRVGLRAQADLQIAIPDQDRWDGVSVLPRVVLGGVIRLGGR